MKTRLHTWASLVLLQLAAVGAPQAVTNEPIWSASPPNNAQVLYGEHVTTAGDVNGDGFDDIVVGARWQTNPEDREGCVWVYHGSIFGPSPTADWTFEGNADLANAGFGVASAGDINGDGFDDLIVGAPYLEAGAPATGQAFVFFGSLSGLSTTPDWTASGDQELARFGQAVVSAGDVNGDGFDDILIGEPWYDNPDDREGKAFLYYGSPSGPSMTPDWTDESDMQMADFGTSLAAGDVNGDGYSDVIIGASFPSSFTNGRLFIYHGSFFGLSSTPDTIVVNTQNNDSFANFGALSAGDVNGDGFTDVLVGARTWDGSDTNEGRALLYLGSNAGVSTSPAWVVEGNDPYANFAQYVAYVGDVNRDGYGDVVVARPFASLAFLYIGNSGGLSNSPFWTGNPAPGLSGRFGEAVGAAGDVNQDGFPDIIVGAKNINGGNGRAYVFAGGLLSRFRWEPQFPEVAQPVQFIDQSDGNVVSWQWDLDGDGSIDSTDQNPLKAFPRAGPWKVTLTVGDGRFEDSQTETIRVGANLLQVTDVFREYTGFFLEGTDETNEFDARVDWQGTPGTVAFSVVGGSNFVEPGLVAGARHDFNLKDDFQASMEPSRISIVPTNGEGFDGPPWMESVSIIPYPQWLRAALSVGLSGAKVTTEITDNTIKYGIKAQMPPKDPLCKDGSCEFEIPEWVPILDGQWGLAETQAKFKGLIASNDRTEIEVSGKTGLAIADTTLEVTVKGSGEWEFTDRDGLDLIAAAGELSVKGSVKKERGLVELIPQLAYFADLPGVEWFNERAKVVGEIGPSITFTAAFEQFGRGGPLAWKESTGKVSLDLKATLKVEVNDRIEASGWVAGGGSIKLGVPDPLLRELKAGVEFGAKYEIDGLFGFLASDGQIVCHFDCMWTPSAGFGCPYECEGESATVRNPILHNDLLRHGPYSVRTMERVPRKQVPSLPRSAESTSLFANVFSDASPTLVEAGSGRLLLWQHQDLADPTLQSLEIAWSYDSGSGFGPMGLIADDTRTEMSPKAAVDGNGDVVAVWQRIQDPAFITPINALTDLPLFYNELELVSAVFDPTSQSWGAVTPLTGNSALDDDVELSSDGAGNLLLTWMTNPGGRFLSSATDPSTLSYSTWDAGTQSWSAPAAISTGLVGVTGHSAAFKGTEAAVLVQRDPDTAMPDDGVLDLYTWDVATWSAASTFAAGGVENRLPSIVYDGAGVGQVVWVRDDDLVQATLADPTPTTIRAGSGSMAFYGARLLTDGSGNLTLVWPEVDGGSANLFATILDSSSGVWSADRRLTQEEEVVHRRPSAHYGSDGVLRAAYLATEIQRVTRDVTVGGEMVTIVDVPVDGPTELRLLEHVLGTDLATADSELSIDPALPDPGDMVDAALVLHNSGSFAISGFDVELYVGEPMAGGILVGSTHVPGPLPAGAELSLPFSFIYPSGGGNVTALIDALGVVTETDETNNEARVYLDNIPPDVLISASVTSGDPPLSVDLSAALTDDPDGDRITRVVWSFGDDTDSEEGTTLNHVFMRPGDFVVTATVTDSRGAVGSGTVLIEVAGAAGTVPDGAGVLGELLTVDRLTGGDLDVSWGASPCALGDDDYALYQGTLGSFTGHTPVICSTGGGTSHSFTPAAGDTYYLAVPHNGSWEGSAGKGSDGLERTSGASSCFVQAVGTCNTCGNGLVEATESCDGSDLAGESCLTQGFDAGVLACAEDCGGFSAVDCYFDGCANGLLDAGEACDGLDLQGETCLTQGFGGGTLACNPFCTALDTTGCHLCGNGVCEPAGGEDCLSCAADCNGEQGGSPANRYCCGDGAGDTPVSCLDARCSASGNTCCPDPLLPQQGLVLRLESDLGVTTSGTTVVGWQDQSTRGNDLTAVGEPTQLAGALNGVDVISLDGVDDLLQRQVLQGFPDAASDRTLFLLARYDGVGYGGFSYGSQSGCNRVFGLAVDSAGNLMVQGWCEVASGGGDFISSEPGTGAGWLIQSAVLQSDTLSHYKDGVLIDSQSHTYATLLSDLIVGAEIDRDPFVDMGVAAILIYDRALTDAERVQVEGYLHSRFFGLTCP